MKTRYLLLVITSLNLFFLSGCEKRYVPAALVEFHLRPQTECENILRALLTKENAKAELIPIKNTELFQIRVPDVEAQKAADEANRLADVLQTRIKKTYPDAKILIWERASPTLN